MGQYVDLGGIRTWYEIEGEGEPLLLLHGGFCTNESWGILRPSLAAKYQVFLPERRAHGHTPDVKGPLSYNDMAKDTINFLELVVKGSADLIGWSDGGIVALLIAIARPDLARKMVVIGSNFDTSGYRPVVREMFEQLQPDTPNLTELRALYNTVSPDGAGHWPVVVSKMVEMFRREPHILVNDLRRIRARTLVMVGDDDFINPDHTVALYDSLPDSELAIVPGTSHALIWEQPSIVSQLISDFLGRKSAATRMPLRRAGLE